MHSENTTIRLVAVDMDGTLLHDDKSISDYTLDVLRKIVKKEKPDIIHLHSSKAGALGRLLVGTGKAKMFYTPHGYSFLMENPSEE